MLMSSSDKAAKLYYGPSAFRVLRPGQHVLCAVTGEAIPLEELRYWSAEHQEAYATAEIATRRLLGEVQPLNAGG
ncbi:hypothetical protein MACH24_04490 [Erythrobacter sp. Dej080120_24]|jgi:hypothetical protein|uniref:DUF2093 domain-containing protein n=1 Tax=Erythrobacter TaxID=1041 RepID=UPI0020794EEB|nr:DUF2093 domain-containing protein [Erythrobacter aurantius]BDW81011.1 hypothetical protein MACH24_04490 [Erythrobacter sp. Dej080120_24]